MRVDLGETALLVHVLSPVGFGPEGFFKAVAVAPPQYRVGADGFGRKASYLLDDFCLLAFFHLRFSISTFLPAPGSAEAVALVVAAALAALALGCRRQRKREPFASLGGDVSQFLRHNDYAT